MDFFDPACSAKRAGRKDRRAKDDICASEFFSAGEWERAVREVADLKPVNYDDYRKVVNKLAAHLTYSRIEYAERAQRDQQGFTPSKEVTDYLLSLAAAFRRTLPDQRAAWFGGMVLG